MLIYLAAPIFTPQQLEVVEFIKTSCEAYHHEVFSPYHNSTDIWQGRAPKDCSPAERRQVLDDNISNIDWCDVLLAWVGGMGGFTDPGVIWEMGYAFRGGKYTLCYIDPEMDAERQSMNLMLAGTVDSVIKDRGDLLAALSLMRDGQGDALAEVTAVFPSSVLGQEAEPIV